MSLARQLTCKATPGGACRSLNPRQNLVLRRPRGNQLVSRRRLKNRVTASSENNPDTTPSDQTPADVTASSVGLSLAVGAVALGAALFVGLRGGPESTTFETLQAEAIPLNQAQANGLPTVVEFYASW